MARYYSDVYEHICVRIIFLPKDFMMSINLFVSYYFLSSESK